MVIEPCPHCNKYHTGVQCNEIKATTIAGCHDLYSQSRVEIKKTEYVTKEKHDRLRTALEGLVEAGQKAIPCLEDWIRTTGFGEVNRRDKAALAAIKAAIAAAEAVKEGK